MAGFDPFPTIRTDNLVLRRMEQTDLQDIFAMRSDPRMHEHTDTKPDQTLAETGTYIERMDTGVRQGKWVIWAMEHRPSRRVVGTISIWNLDSARASGELGFGIIPEFQGRGLMREALSRVVDYGFEMMGLRVIEAYTEADNARARRLLESAGFAAVDTVDEPGYSVERVFHMVVHRLEKEVKMSGTKLVIICGMSGCGKSTTAQNVSYQYTRNGIPHEWLHEEMKDHPIRWANGGEFTVGDLHSEEGMAANIRDTYERWDRLIADMTAKGGVYVMEGCLFQNIVRYFIPSGYPVDRVRAYYDRLFQILAPANPHIIHLYRPDVAASFQKAFAVRGKRWENIITGSVEDFAFADETNYQALAREIFADYKGAKLAIDTSGEDWDAYHKEICGFVGIRHFDREYLPVDDPERYVGLFEYQESGVYASANVICEDGELFLSPSWFTHIRMNRIEPETFELSAFPMIFRYDFSGDDATITVSGNYDWGIVGRTLRRSSQPSTAR